MGDLIPQGPEQDRPLRKKERVLGEIQDAKREAKRLRLQTAIPAIKAIKDELVERAKDGRLKQQLANRALGSLLRDLAVIKQVLDDNMPMAVVVTPPAPAAKDVTHYRAKSAVRLTDKDRANLRKQVEAGEVIDAGSTKETQ